MGDWRDDLSDSAFEFQRAVWPAIRHACGDGDLVPVESVTETGFAKQLDMSAGIDAWQIKSSCGLRGIASRVQWDNGRSDYPYCTFTIRHSRTSGAETEYVKRRRAVNGDAGWLFPFLTVQAYFAQPKRSGALLSCGVARTKDLLTMIEREKFLFRRTVNATFMVVPFLAMRDEGFRVFIWNPSDSDNQRVRTFTAEEASPVIPSAHAEARKPIVSGGGPPLEVPLTDKDINWG